VNLELAVRTQDAEPIDADRAGGVGADAHAHAADLAADPRAAGRLARFPALAFRMHGNPPLDSDPRPDPPGRQLDLSLGEVGVELDQLRDPLPGHAEQLGDFSHAHQVMTQLNSPLAYHQANT